MKSESTHVYTWESEPADERPSEFMPTCYSQLFGFYTLADSNHRAPARRWFGFRSLLVFAVVVLVLGLGAFAIGRLAPLLHA